MDCTTLNLLTRDGVVAVTFAPALTGDQYLELYDLVLGAETAVEMTASVRLAAIRWGGRVAVDAPILSPLEREQARQSRDHEQAVR